MSALRSAVASIEKGEMQNAENVKQTRRCLALALFAAGCHALKQKQSNDAHGLFDDAIRQRPGLGDERRREAQRYRAYARYAVAKELMHSRKIEACATFNDVLDARGVIAHFSHTTSEAARSMQQCEDMTEAEAGTRCSNGQKAQSEGVAAN